MLILDSAADQFTRGGPAQDIAYYADKKVLCNNYIKDTKTHIVCEFSIFGDYSIIKPSAGENFITLIH